MSELRRTTCNRDCPDACGIVATVSANQVVKIGGDPSHPVTRGFLCYRTNHFLATQNAPSRLTTPLLRKDGKLVPVSFDEAIGFVAKRLLAIRNESGPASIFHYQSGGTLGLMGKVLQLYWERFGPVTTKSGDICSGAGEAAQIADFGVSDSSDVFDLLHSKNIVIWGKNLFTSSPHTLTVVKDAKARGARVTLIDPVFQRTQSIADRYVAVRPGGDFALAMAVAGVLFEQELLHPEVRSYCDGLDEFELLVRSRSRAAWQLDADVSSEEVQAIAQALAEGPTSILVGWGMARRKNGGAVVRALDALGAITGNIGIEGAGVSYYFRRRSAFNAEFVSGAAARHISEPLFGRELSAQQDPPVRAVWITAGNPVAMLPDSHSVKRALLDCELVVVVDPLLTETAKLATVVFPTTTLLEADDLLGAYGHHLLATARPVIEPPSEVRSDLQIIQALAARTGLTDVVRGSAREWKQRMLRPELAAHGVDLEGLDEAATPNPLAPKVLFEGRVFHTPNGKAQLVGQTALPPPAPSPQWPLLLASLSTPKSQSSQWAVPVTLPLELSVHPESAAGVADGDIARLESRLGSIAVRVVHDARQRRDIALLPKGGHLEGGSAANALVQAELTDIGEGAALYDEPVRIVAGSPLPPTDLGSS